MLYVYIREYIPPSTSSLQQKQFPLGQSGALVSSFNQSLTADVLVSAVWLPVNTQLQTDFGWLLYLTQIR